MADDQTVDPQQDQTVNGQSSGQTPPRKGTSKLVPDRLATAQIHLSDVILLAPLQWEVWIALQDAEAAGRTTSYRQLAERTNSTIDGVRKAVRLLQRYLAQRWDDLPYLFPSRNHRPLSRQRIDALYRGYATKAQLPGHKRHVHCLRHSIATHMLDAGRSLEEVQDHLGHRSIRSTQVYAKISEARRERVAVALELAPEVARLGSRRRRPRNTM